MTKRAAMPKDTNQRGASIVAQATADKPDAGTVIVLSPAIPRSALRKVLRLPTEEEESQSAATETPSHSSEK